MPNITINRIERNEKNGMIAVSRCETRRVEPKIHGIRR